MKILCLHGYGSNADIFQYQIRRLREACDASWEFHVLEGEESCLTSSEIQSRFPGPYLCYTREFDPTGQAEAHALVHEAITNYGPFDGALGFSQGGSVLLSYLLEGATRDSAWVSPFQFLILCSPSAPLAESPAYCHTALGSLSDEDEARLRSGQDAQIARLPKPARLVAQTLAVALDATREIMQLPRSFFFDRPPQDIPCVLHPEVLRTRLSLPVLHVRGRDDLVGMEDWNPLVEEFFSSAKQRTFEHGSGHNVPQSPAEVQKLVAAMEWVVAQSQLPTY